MLLRYWFVEKLDEAGSREEALPVFIRWEQLASYARFLAGDTGFRGTTRTRAFLSEGARVTISAQPVYQTLANQKIYGLWGLYSQAARASGLLDEKELRLTPEARQLAEKVYRDLLGPTSTSPTNGRASPRASSSRRTGCCPISSARSGRSRSSLRGD